MTTRLINVDPGPKRSDVSRIVRDPDTARVSVYLGEHHGCKSIELQVGPNGDWAVLGLAPYMTRSGYVTLAEGHMPIEGDEVTDEAR